VEQGVVGFRVLIFIHQLMKWPLAFYGSKVKQDMVRTEIDLDPGRAIKILQVFL